MINYELDKEDQEILEAYEKGDFKSVLNLEEGKQKLVAAKGLPYQTLVSSVLYQYSNDKIKELA